MGLFDNNGLVELISNYLKTQFEIIKLDVQEQLEALLVRVFKFIILAFAMGIACIFLLLGIANLLNDYLESLFWGYFIVAACSFLVGLILLKSNQVKPIEEEIEPQTIPSDESE